MALINAETKLCDVILHEPSVIPVINRFGIILGVGDKSIRTVCEEKNLDCEFFVTILNTFINEDYFPENRLKSFCATQIVNYLTQTNAYYEQFQIPNIVFQIISRIGNDQIIDILNGRIIRYPISVEKSRRIGKLPAIVMDSHIGKCI